MLKRKICTRKEALLALMIVTVVNSSFIQKNKQKIRCVEKKVCCKDKCRRRRCLPVCPCHPNHCHRHRLCPRPCPRPRPRPRPCPSYPIVPVRYPSDPIVDKECCGNFLIQGNQPQLQIWEADVDTKTTVVQISMYSNPTSSEVLQVEIDGLETTQMYVPPGNTSNFIGQNINTIKISSKGNDFSYVEGKYNISTTLQLHADPPLIKEQ